MELYIPKQTAAQELAAACSRKIAIVKASSLMGATLRIDLDPKGFISHGDLFLFVNAIERFLAAYATLKSIPPTLNYQRNQMELCMAAQARNPSVDLKHPHGCSQAVLSRSSHEDLGLYP